MPRPVSSTFHEKLLRAAFQQILRNASFYISLLTWTSIGVVLVVYCSFLGYLGYGTLFVDTLMVSSGGFRGLLEATGTLLSHLPPVPSYLTALTMAGLSLAAMVSRIFIDRSIMSLEGDENESFSSLDAMDGATNYATISVMEEES